MISILRPTFDQEKKQNFVNDKKLEDLKFWRLRCREQVKLHTKYIHYNPLMMSQKVAPKKNQKTCLIESGNDTFHASVYSSNVLCQINVVYACLFPAKLVS